MNAIDDLLKQFENHPLIAELTHLRAENARLTAYDGSQALMPYEEWQTLTAETRARINAYGLKMETLRAENARLTAECEAAWIPVTKRLPEKETSDLGEEYIVLLCYPYEMAIAASFVGGDWYTGHVGCSTRWTDKVTHWQPLPLHPDAARQAVTRVTDEPAKLTLDPAARIT